MEPQPSPTVFVGNLPGDITDDQVNEIFGAYGNIQSCKALPARNPGMKGAAIITFQSLEESQWVQQNLNGNIAQGLTEPCTVKYSNPTPKGAGIVKGGDANGYGKAAGKGKGYTTPYTPPGKNGGGKAATGQEATGKGGASETTCDILTLIKGIAPACPGHERVPDEHQVYITGLPSDTTDLDLYKMFSPFGAINQKGVKAMRRDNQCSGIGFVDFTDAAMAQLAIDTLNGTTMPDGTVLQLMIKNSTRKGGPKGGGKKGKW